jgi:alpha-methylacyl-CoA racemase
VPAARFDRTPAAVPGPAPRIGEHTVAILTELGLDATQVERLRSTLTVRLVSAD